MDPHNMLNASLKMKAGGGAVINDPGTGNTFNIDKDGGICKLTIAAVGETRTMPAAASLGEGVQFTVVANQITSSGTAVINGVTLDAEGEAVTMTTMLVNDAMAWVNSTDMPVYSNADLVLNSTNEANLTYGGTVALAFDDAAITSNTAATDTAGKSLFAATQGGGASTAGQAGVAGGSVSLTAGSGSAAFASSNGDGGSSGSISFVTGAGAAGDGVGVSGRAGAVRLRSSLVTYQQGGPGALNSTGALTAALIMGGIVTSTTGAGVTATLDDGTTMDLANPTDMGTSEGFYWSVINTGGNTFTVTSPGASHTIVGAGAVATVTSGRFFSRRTATATWITYRVA